MNAVLGRIASTAEELAHYHSGDGNISLTCSCSISFFFLFVFLFAIDYWSISSFL